MEKLIRYQNMWALMNARDKKGRPVPFDVEFVKVSTGELVRWKGCWLTSYHAKGTTINVQCPGENHPKKIHRLLITRFNGAKVYL